MANSYTKNKHFYLTINTKCQLISSLSKMHSGNFLEELSVLSLDLLLQKSSLHTSDLSDTEIMEQFLDFSLGGLHLSTLEFMSSQSKDSEPSKQKSQNHKETKKIKTLTSDLILHLDPNMENS